MKRVLLTNAMGPYELGWGEDMYDIFGARLTRGQSVFSLWGHVHAWPLYIIAENIPAHSTVLESPSPEIYIEELKRGYDYVAIQIKSVHTPKVAEMVKLAKEIAPDTKVIVGGYGVMLLYNPVPYDPDNCASYILDTADYICYEEGICFFRKLLGSDMNAPITQKYMPCCGATLKNFQHLVQFKATGILVALGCPNACEFCSTTAYFKYKKITISSPEQCFQDLKFSYERLSGGLAIFTMVFDEDFLLDKDYIMRLGELIRESDMLDKINFFCFGSIKALSQYTAEELALCGVGAIWIGFESKFEEVFTSEHNIQKRVGRDIGAVFKDLHSYGIMVASSNILGWDFHTRENIVEDIDYFVSLKPDMYQVSPLTPCPGTVLYGRMKEQGRIYDKMTWEDGHLWKLDVFKVKNFDKNEIKNYYDYCHDKLYKNNGPTILSLTDVMLQGYRTMLHSTNPHLQARGDRCFYFARKAGPPLFYAIKKMAPSDAVRERVLDIEKRYHQYIGYPTLAQKIIARYVIYPLIRINKWREDRPGFTNKSDPPWRITYYHDDNTPPVVIRRRNAVAFTMEKGLRAVIEMLISFKPAPIHHIRLNSIDDFDVDFKTMEIEGNLMNYVDEGEGEVLLMLHGNPTWSYLYRHFIKGLKKDYRCIALDNLGYGLSDKPVNGDYTMNAHIRRLGKFIENLDLKNITLVCQDWGGIIGLSYAARNKEKFKRLIPMNTTGFLPSKIGEFLKCFIGAPAMPLLWLFKVPIFGKKMAMDWHLFVKLGMKVAVHNRKRQIHEKAMRGYLYPFQRIEDRTAIMKSVRQIPILPMGPIWRLLKETGELMKGWNIKTQVIWGMKDPVFVPWFIEKFEELLPNHSPSLRIPSASHFLQDDEPEIIISKIKEFLSEKVIDGKVESRDQEGVKAV